MTALLGLVCFAVSYAVFWAAAVRRAARYESRLSFVSPSTAAPATGAVLATCLYHRGEDVPMALAFSGLAVCVTSDLQVGLVFDAVMLLASVLFLGVGDGEAWMTALAGSLASSFLVSIPFITTKGRGLGFGDVKLAAFCGLILGYPLSVASVWFAFVIGGTIGVVLIRTKRLRPQASVPFAPFLAAGTGCALLCSRIVR